MRSLLFCLVCALGVQAQVRFDTAQWTTNRDLAVRVVQAGSPYLTLEKSHDLVTWEPLATAKTLTANDFLDTGAGYRPGAYYRAVEVNGANTLTGDHITTTQGPLTIHPVNHASFVFSWNGLMIYNDPVGGASAYTGLPRADLILVSHSHGDHFDASTLSAVRNTNQSRIIVPQAVYNSLNATLKALAIVLTNGTSTNLLGLQIDAVPAYNGNHPKGTGNGYVIDLGGKRLYMSGDTGAVEEMKTLKNIEAAFLCMNVPFTMTVSQASAIVREFAPRIVYPYHFRNQDGTFSDLNLFRRQVGADRGIEVRARKWY